MIKASNRLWRRGLSSLSSVRLREIFACSALIGVLGLLVGGALPVGAQTNDPYAASVLGDGPVAYYRLNDTGATAVDSSGNSNNLGPIGAAVAKGQPGLLQTDNDTAMGLPGQTNAAGVIEAPGRVPALEPANALSVEVWGKPNALPTQNWNRVKSETINARFTKGVIRRVFRNKGGSNGRDVSGVVLWAGGVSGSGNGDLPAS